MRPIPPNCPPPLFLRLEERARASAEAPRPRVTAQRLLLLPRDRGYLINQTSPATAGAPEPYPLITSSAPALLLASLLEPLLRALIALVLALLQPPQTAAGLSGAEKDEDLSRVL